MFCKYCGNAMENGAKFCQNCGKAVEIEQEPQPVIQPMPIQQPVTMQMQQPMPMQQPAPMPMQQPMPMQATQYPNNAPQMNGQGMYYAQPPVGVNYPNNYPVVKKRRVGILAILGGLIMALGTIFPVMSASSFLQTYSFNFYASKELTESEIPVFGWFILATAMITVLCGILGRRIFSLIMAGGSLAFAICMIIPAYRLANAVDGYMSIFGSSDIGYGFWFIFGGFALVVIDFIVALASKSKM